MAGDLRATNLIDDGSGATRSFASIIAGAARTWVSLSYSGGAPTSRDSYGVSSLTDTGTGQATANWSTAFADANYGVLVTGQSNPLGNGQAPIAQRAAGTQRIDGFNDSGVAADTTLDAAAYDN